MKDVVIKRINYKKKPQVCRQINQNVPLVYLLADEARAFMSFEHFR